MYSCEFATNWSQLRNYNFGYSMVYKLKIMYQIIWYKEPVLFHMSVRTIVTFHFGSP